MKRTAVAAALALTLHGQPAHAQLAVADFGTEFATLNGYLQDVKIWIQDNTSWLDQLKQLAHEAQTDLNIATMLYGFVHDPSLGALLGIMGMTGLTNDLPINPYALMGMVSGYGGINSVNGIVSRVSLLGSIVPTTYSTDQIYTCAGQDFGCSQSQNRAAANAGHKSALLQLYSTLTGHTQVLQTLRSEALQSSDPKTTADLNVQASTEQAYIASSAAQATIVTGLAEAQRDTLRQQGAQQFQSETDGLVAACRARGACP